MMKLIQCKHGAWSHENTTQSDACFWCKYPERAWKEVVKGASESPEGFHKRLMSELFELEKDKEQK
jgi:hypothetical protein